MGPSPAMTTAQAGLTCPQCSSVEVRTTWQTFANGTRHVRATCGQCGKFLRYLPQGGREEPAAKVEMSNPRPAETDHPSFQPPPASWKWIGYLRSSDQRWRPVAVSGTLEGVWDTLLTTWQRGDLLAMPVDPAALPRIEQPMNGKTTPPKETK